MVTLARGTTLIDGVMSYISIMSPESVIPLIVQQVTLELFTKTGMILELPDKTHTLKMAGR